MNECKASPRKLAHKQVDRFCSHTVRLAVYIIRMYVNRLAACVGSNIKVRWSLGSLAEGEAAAQTSRSIWSQTIVCTYFELRNLNPTQTYAVHS